MWPASATHPALPTSAAARCLLAWALLAGCRSVPSGWRSAEAAPTCASAWEVTQVRRVQDQVRLAVAGGTLTVTVTSRAGIGSAQVVYRGGDWPRELRLCLRYAEDRPFVRTEGLCVALCGACPCVLAKSGAAIACEADGTVLRARLPASCPAGTGLAISWVDFYR